MSFHANIQTINFTTNVVNHILNVILSDKLNKIYDKID